MPVDLTEPQQALLREMQRKWEAADTTHKPLRTQWDRLDALYHSRRDFLRSYAGAVDRDRRGIIDDARKEFGADLLIPYAFSVVETVLPRLLSNRPRMLWTPRNGASERNVENVTVVCDAQQHRANYELKLQTTGRSGLIYGLGVQKVYWRREVAERKVLRKRIILPGFAEDTQPVVVWDDPDVDDVSIWDFMWDSYGSDMTTVGWVFHRSWRSTRYVLSKFASGAWDGLPDLTAEDLEGAGGKERYVESWQGRWNAQGGKTMELREPVHEVWEYHDGRRVVTVLNRQWPVAEAENPAWHGQLPFHIFRPTEVLHQFAGKGEIEPIEDLQHEMNMLRTDRRWNALLKLHVAHWIQDGLVDLDEVKIGPGALIPVDAGGMPLRDIMQPVNVGDIPNSGYQEEAALQADIERVSGISDPVSGGTGGEQTATGIQLIQAAAGLRIQNKTRRVELELIKPEAEQWLALNQQRITEQREIPIPQVPQPGQPDRRWAWRKIGPEELAGEFDVEPDGGSTAPDNIPQMRQDAQMLQGLLGVPGLDPQKLLPLILEKLGIKAPEAYLAPAVRVPPQTLDLLAQMLTEQAGMDPAQVKELVGSALNAALDQEGQAQAAGGQQPAEAPQPPEQQQAA
jgi:hypothetical protein